MTEERRRVVTWDDPHQTAQAGRERSGLDAVNAMKDGTIPRAPFALLIGLDIMEVEAGRVLMTLIPGEHLLNPLGTVHGGMLATALDSAMGCAVQSTLPTGRGYTTLELKVNYIRAGRTTTGLLMIEGRVLHSGRQSAVAEGTIKDSSGRLYASASTTCLVFDLPAPTLSRTTPAAP